MGSTRESRLCGNSGSLRAKRGSAQELALASMQPMLPQLQGVASGPASMTMCPPMQAAWKCLPRMSLPSIMAAAPTPVPKIIITTSRVSCAQP